LRLFRRVLEEVFYPIPVGDLQKKKKKKKKKKKEEYITSKHPQIALVKQLSDDEEE